MSPQPARAPALAPPSPIQGAGHWIGIPLLRSLWRVRSLGTRHVPTHGPVILAGNHSNFADGPLMFAFAPRPARMLIKQEMFSGALGPVLRGMGHIAVERGVADRAMITGALDTLARGEVLGVFPEGTRGSGDFSSVQGGLAYMALRSGAPVVPVACLGTGDRGSSVSAVPSWRARVDVVFGAPVTVGGDGVRASRTAVAEASRTLVERLTAHLGEARRLTGRDGG